MQLEKETCRNLKEDKNINLLQYKEETADVLKVQKNNS